MSVLPHPDRRNQGDRRARPTSPFTRASLFGRRQHIRRKEDLERHRFVDRYSSRAVAAVLVVVLLSMVDAALTLKLLDLGVAREANPVMDFFIRQGTLVFLLVKFLLTAVCVLSFLVLKNFNYFREKISVKSMLVFVCVMYAVLIVYELSLFAR